MHPSIARVYRDYCHGVASSKDKKLSPYEAAIMKGASDAAEYLQPVCDPVSDIDDDEFERRKEQERQDEIIRQKRFQVEEELRRRKEEEAKVSVNIQSLSLGGHAAKFMKFFIFLST